ncbi:MAG: redox-sensing transcriptional repressor Rex [Acutalibacteraceae bacterium]
MQKKDRISMSVIRRLPRYYRFLSELERRGISRISSRELSDRMGLTASQIRQDLNCFGGFGQQGYGYMVHQLKEEIGGILGLNAKHKTILIGAGNLGRAVATHMSFESKGFSLIGIFDSNPDLIGQKIRNIPVMDPAEIEAFCKANAPTVAILCLPMAAAEGISKQLIALGIKNFWNFSHYDFSAQHPDVIVENVHMNDSLMTLCYRITNREQNKED